MKHYVLTRSAYGPEWDIEANRRRLEMTRAVTIPLMAAQKFRDWTWIVALDPSDPLLDERMTMFSAAAPSFVPLLWRHPEHMERVPWDPEPGRSVKPAELVAASVYRAPWRSLIPSDVRVLQTRLDDDDGLMPNALLRYQRAAEKCKSVKIRHVLMFPRGIRVYGPRFAIVRHNSNAMQTLVTHPGDTLCVYDYGHTKCNRIGPVFKVDNQLGWIWTRHRDTISGWRETQYDMTDRMRKQFPIDWPVVESAA